MKYYTAEEAAKKLKVSTGHIYELVKRGQIKKKEGMGRSIRIPSTELGKVSTERNYFTYNTEKIELINTHLGKVRKLKSDDLFVCVDIIKAIGIKDSYAIVKAIDKKYTRLLNRNEAKELGIFVNQCGILVISYHGLKEYSKKSMSPINWDKFLKELKVNDYEQVEFKEEKELNQLTNMFEGHKVEIITENGQVLFEIYSTGMALGYSRSDGKSISDHGGQKLFPRKDRIDKIIENADIKPSDHSGHKYLTEEQLYDFMLEARTEKCKSFRKWVTNEVLPTIRKNGGYVDNADKFTDNYFSNLSLEVRRAIRSELITRNRELVNRKRELIAESQEIKREYDINNEVIEQLN